MKTTKIINQLEDINTSLDYLSNYETENILYSLSFSQSFIETCYKFPALDDLLLDSISAIHSNCVDTVKCNLQSMIDILS